MRKPKGIKRPQVKSKSPGAAPTSVHLQPIQRKRKGAPKSTHDPSPNLGRYLHKAKETKLGPAKKIGSVASVAKSIKSSKGKLINV